MSKPDDIPQDVWDKAVWSLEYPHYREAIARAIMAAKAEEREECAKIASDAKFGREATARSAMAEGDAEAAVLAAMQAKMAEVISQAIRNGRIT